MQFHSSHDEQQHERKTDVRKTPQTKPIRHERLG
jgi:hypothetical protein